MQWKYLIFRLIFIQKLNLFFFEFQNIWLIKNLKSPVRLTLFIKIFYNEALVIKILVLTIGVIICHKSSQIRLMINHMLLKIQIYYRLTLCINCSPLKFKFKKFKFWILFIFKMSTSNSSYRLIYSRFGGTSIHPTPESFIEIKDEAQVEEPECESVLDEEYFDIFKETIKNKREIKQLRKIHNEMFDIYVDKLTYVTHDTAKSYSKMISQFILYSPGIDPTDLEPFLASKFNLPIKGGVLISKLKGNALKYFKCINRFLQRVYSSEFSELNPEYSKTIKSKYRKTLCLSPPPNDRNFSKLRRGGLDNGYKILNF